MNVMKKSLLLLVALLGMTTVEAKVVLSPLIADDMVLQRDAKVEIWGLAKAGSRVSVVPSWSGRHYETIADGRGNWSLKVATTGAGGPYQIRISDGEERVLHNILLGDVWVCSGQSNMEIPVKGFTSQPIENSLDFILESKKYDQIRVFTVEEVGAVHPQEDVPGRWDQPGVETTPDFSATAYFFARALNDYLGIPIGIVHSSWGGSLIEAWMDRASIEKYDHFDEKEIVPNVKNPNRRPTMLYNAMIHPLRHLTIKGFTWYQGEANCWNYKQYPSMFGDMVRTWRSLFQDAEDAPFYFVQIAPYSYGNSEKEFSAFLREAQLQCLEIPNTGMAVTLDTGEEEGIHPAKKEIVGKRLAYQALAKTYHVAIPCDGPVLKSTREVEGKLELQFDHADGGLYPVNCELPGFEVAGEDGRYVPAKAVAGYGDKMKVWSEKVKKPRYVRYGFRNYFQGCLYNGYKLPASSFRNDGFEPKQDKKK